MPAYHMISTTFADLHDTPQRMMAKGVISEILEWKTSREFFYWKVKRRILEFDVEKKLKIVNKKLNHGQILSMLRRWFLESKGPVQNYLWDDDRAVVDWFGSPEEQQIISDNIKMIQKDTLIQKIDRIASKSEDTALEAVIGLLQRMSPRQQDEVRKLLETQTNKGIVEDIKE